MKWREREGRQGGGGREAGRDGRRRGRKEERKEGGRETELGRKECHS